MLTQEQKKQILDKIEACFVKADAHYKRTLKRPTQVEYTLKGGSAGTANPRNHVLNFNAALALRDWNDMITNTVPHEVAHLIDYEINNKLEEQMLARSHAIERMHLLGRRVKMPKRDVHGYSWQSVMRVLGAVPKRTHNVDTTGIVRRKSRHSYRCDCGGTLVVGAKHHNAILRGARVTHRGCGRVLTPTMHLGRQAPAQPAVVAQVPEPKAPAAPGAGTKMERAVAIVNANATLGAAGTIAIIMRELGMSKAGAQTYYYTARKQR